MSISKVVAGTSVVIVAFCTGIAFQFDATAQGPSEPHKPLTSVAHDASLVGDGTTANPLGVSTGGVQTGNLANGVVTLPKLSISGSPSVGSVIGYNGSGLAWQTASRGGGARVVDSVGHSYPLAPNPGGSAASAALWQIGGETVAIPLSTTGFVTNLFNNALYYTSSDCSGPAYFFTGEDATTQLVQSPTQNVYITGTTLHYPGTVQQVTLNSTNTTVNSRCSLLTINAVPANPVVTADLSSAFVPPFHIELN